MSPSLLRRRRVSARASARVSQSVTHNLCIFVPLKAPLATSLMPFLVSRLSGETSQVTDPRGRQRHQPPAALTSALWGF